MVLVASDHLILSREKPVEPLWITYYVFMTLNFDNMLPGFFWYSIIPKDTSGDTCIRILERIWNLGCRLVRFISYVRTMERAPTWKVDVYEPTSPTSTNHVRRWQHAGFKQHAEFQLMMLMNSRSDHIQRLFLVWIPVAFAISLNTSSRASRPQSA